MVSVSGAAQAVPLSQNYSALSKAISDLQAAVAAGATITELSARVSVGGSSMTMDAGITLSAADTATIFNDLIAIYQAQQSSISSQLSAIS